MTRATQRLVILTGNGPVAHDQSWGWFVHGMPAELSGITRVTPTATLAIAMNLMAAPQKNLAKQDLDCNAFGVNNTTRVPCNCPVLLPPAPSALSCKASLSWERIRIQSTAQLS
jgi:hypothetical protein